jgi:hypothetical protein
MLAHKLASLGKTILPLEIGLRSEERQKNELGRRASCARL